MIRKISLLFLSIFILNSCSPVKNIDTDYARDRNICKQLKGKALVYMVFVDTKNNNVWTDFDINTAFQGAGEAVEWMRTKAKQNNVQLDVDIKYFQSGKMKTVPMELPFKTVRKTLNTGGQAFGVYNLNRWADKVALAVGKKIKFPGEVDNSIIKKPKNNVELISKLRDIYRVENVALIYLINNNYTNDISIAVNTTSDKKIEYAIASTKSASTLGHLMLNLFGAADLKQSPYKKVPYQMEPASSGDIMASGPSDKLDQLNIGPKTMYYIGWKESADSTKSK